MDRKEDRLLTLEEAAKELCAKPRTIRDWVKQGKLTGRYIGGKILVTHSDILRFIAASPVVPRPTKRNDPSNN